MNYIDEQIKYLKGRRNIIREKLLKLGVPEECLAHSQRNDSLFYHLNVQNLKDLKIAGIMDRFTLESYAPECQLMELTPDEWKTEIDTFEPDLLFVESAWQGKDNLWYRKIANGSKVFFEMTSYCHEKEIPIVFWNKEDPVWTETFMPAARMADFVFTTDIDCVKKYKEALKHDRVYFLHFAAQPKVHNPIEKYKRKDKYCFAGAYYHKYKKRAEMFDKFAEEFIKTKGFDIYDRNYKNSRPEHAFPKYYDPYILGKLESCEIDIAYKGYNYGVNMNSVDQSQTMFARRVFEMLASNTVTVGNYSRGVKNLFGDLTICTNDSLTLQKELRKWCSDEVGYRKYRLAGLRKVLSEHLYEDRLSYIVEKVFGQNIKPELPWVYVLAEVKTKRDAEYVLTCFDKQKYAKKKLYLVCDEMLDYGYRTDVNVFKSSYSNTLEDFKLPEDAYVSVMMPSNYYGPNYLLDMMLTLRYGQYDGIGKTAYYEKKTAEYVVHNLSSSYHEVAELELEKSVVKFATLLENEVVLKELFAGGKIQKGKFFAVDEFNFCKNECVEECNKVDDLPIYDVGLSLNEIQDAAENIKKDIIGREKGELIRPEEVEKLINNTSKGKIKTGLKSGKLSIKSTLGEEENCYLYIENFYGLLEYGQQGKITLCFDGIGSADFLGVCVFYDKHKKKLAHFFSRGNVVSAEEIPPKAVYFELALRIKGPGEFELSEIRIGQDEKVNEKGCFLSRSNTLILTNQYPSPEELYRNMFVHKRVASYKECGYNYDVMRMNLYAHEEYREFETINIVEGQSETLANILENGRIDTVCVHFMEMQMWGLLKQYLEHIRIIIWLHGADIQPWWRRQFIYNSDEELKRAKQISEQRMEMWRDIFSCYQDHKIELVFVSKHFADMVKEDYKQVFADNRLHIIPNCIDTKMFSYQRKESEQRKKIISIRPYASKIYGNDLMVKAIQELSKEKCFLDLNFLIIGDGELFDSVVSPLKKYKNVEIRKTFLRQSEIADLYHEYGIVLIPSRGDTQGVSRDEAMSCGVVPITNAVAAIPEFVDSSCGILVDAEDYIALAEGIKELYYDEDKYNRLSIGAAERVRSQTSKAFTIDKEVRLIQEEK